MSHLLRILVAVCVLALAGCRDADGDGTTLAQARAGHVTRLTESWRVDEPPPPPPAGVLELVAYAGPLGDMAAYVTPDPGDGRRRPAIIWLVGGFSNSISEIAWTPGPRKNDQSAAGFRAHGIVMMYPSLRGGNTNPGRIEVGFGEVDDVLAAAKHLASLPYVDPARVFLGGHSTGGTLALLVAETGATPFRAIFALGPADDVAGYGQDVLPFDANNEVETMLRAPFHWLGGVRTRTFVIEGSEGPTTNIASLRALQRVSRNPLVSFHPVAGADHFSVIAPLIEHLAPRLATDPGNTPAFDPGDVTALMRGTRGER